jgi:hypothetical protein
MLEVLSSSQSGSELCRGSEEGKGAIRGMMSSLKFILIISSKITH